MSDTEKKQEQETKKPAVREAPPKKGNQQKKETLVYIGPDIPGAKQYTTFNNGLPEALRQRAAEKPFFNSLIVPVHRLAWATVEMAKEGSALNTLYKKASKELGKE